MGAEGDTEAKGSVPVRGAFGWMRKGTWTVLDQGLFAGSNFVINVLLARWLIPEAYGAFTVAFTLFLLLGTVHTGFLSEPMLVFGPGRFRGRVPAYLRALLRGHAGFSVLAGVVLAVMAALAAGLGYPSLGGDLLVLALAQPFLLVAWLMRRACYVQFQPQTAVSGSVIYAVLLVGGAVWLQTSGMLSVATAFAAMSAASVVAAAWVAFRLHVLAGSEGGAVWTETVQHHWRYGRWAAATGAVGWIFGWLSYLILPVFAGLEASGALRALMNLAMPAAHAQAALAVLLVPVFVRAIEEGRLRAAAGWGGGMILLGMVVYGVLLGVFGEPLIGLLYGGQYVEYAHLLWLVGALPVIGALSSLFSAALQAMERPRLIFYANAAAAVTAVTFGVGLIYGLGLLGALLFHAVSDAVATGVKGILLRSAAAGGRAPNAVPTPIEGSEKEFVS